MARLITTEAQRFTEIAQRKPLARQGQSFDTFRRARVISASIMNARVLVLNASFEPINVCTERRAVVMIFKGVARMEEHNGHMLHCGDQAD